MQNYFHTSSWLYLAECIQNVNLILPKYLIYQSYYEVGAEKAQSIASGGWYHSLLVDGKTVALPDPVQAETSGNKIFSQFSLTRDQALAIASSSSMGHAMQLSREAPIFVGYNIDIPVSASQKVGAFIRNCLQR